MLKHEEYEVSSETSDEVIEITEKELTMYPVTIGESLRSGVKTVSGSMPIKFLFPDNYRIPYRDALKKTGYQRRPQDARINKLAQDLLKKRVDVPTSVLLNIRSVKAQDVLQSVGDPDLGLFLMGVGGKDSLLSSTPIIFYVVDGQHRILALKKLYEEDPETWGDYTIHFVCLIGASEAEEMHQFYVVNSTAKSVRTDLALDLLKQRTDQDSRIMEQVTERGERWKVQAQAVVEKLFSGSAIWKNKIRLPNEPKGDTTITSSSMVQSMKLLLDTPFFEALDAENQSKILDAYWKGIRQVLPEVFDDADEYVLQKGVGVVAMHGLLVTVIEILRSNGESVFDPDSYTTVVRAALENLEGENGEGEPVMGSEFWISGSEGAAGGYSSSAGRRVLLSKLKQRLPAMSIE